MKRWDLVTVTRGPDGDVFEARADHPDADLLKRLVASKSSTVRSRATDELRAHLAAAGAPLRSDQPTTPAPAFEELVVAGLHLARRDPEVARGLPVLLYLRLRAGMDLEALADHAVEHGVGHLLGFFLAITGRLADEPALARKARELRDHRVKDQELFLSPSQSRSSKKFALGRAWGFRMRADEEWFASLFDKFAKDANA